MTDPATILGVAAIAGGLGLWAGAAIGRRLGREPRLGRERGRLFRVSPGRVVIHGHEVDVPIAVMRLPYDQDLEP